MPPNRTHFSPALILTLSLLACVHGISHAGSPTAQAPANPGDWCEWLQSKPGTVYKNKENPFLQSLQFGGRFQYQAAFLEGNDANGRDFNGTYDEYRRVRLEMKSDFLQFFSANVKINMVSDDRRNNNDLDWGYDSFDEAIFTFDLKKAFGAGALDALKLNYGRSKFNMTEEVHMSSNKIYTIERSAIANKLYGSPNRATGATLHAKLGKWATTFGVFTGEDDSEFLGAWNDGQVYYFTGSYTHSDQWRFILDFAYNDDSGEDDFAGYGWATALNAVYEDERFGTLSTLVLGGNNDATEDRGGSFHALVVMPWYWVMEDKLQAVLQYQYAGANEAEGMRTNARYVRSAHDAGVSVNSGRGDQLHTLYAGLNYHLCRDHTKVMAGIEYSTLDTPSGDVDTITYGLAFRGFF